MTWLSADATKVKQPSLLHYWETVLTILFPIAPSAVPGLRCPIYNRAGHTARECTMLLRDDTHSHHQSLLATQPGTSDDKYVLPTIQQI